MAGRVSTGNASPWCRAVAGLAAALFVAGAFGGALTGPSLGSGAAPPAEGPLLFGTYLGGSGTDMFFRMQSAGDGNVVLIGRSDTPDFPAAPSWEASPNQSSSGHGFVVKLQPNGARVWGVSMPGVTPQNVAEGSGGDVYITGQAEAGLPTTTAAFERTFGGGPSDAFVMRLDGHTGAIRWATYLGGAGDSWDDEWANDIAVDPRGDVYVGGFSSATDFPVTETSIWRADGSGGPSGGGVGNFIASLAPNGSSLRYSTFLGGVQIMSLAVDPEGELFLTGSAASMATTSGAFQATRPAPSNTSTGFVLKVNAEGTGVVYATYLGGPLYTEGCGLVLDPRGGAVVTGTTRSGEFPGTAGGVNRTGREVNGFVAELSPDGRRLTFATLLVNTSWASPCNVEMDANGDLYVAGVTEAFDFPRAGPWALLGGDGGLCSACGGPNGFLTVFSGPDHSMTFSTLFGGSGDDGIRGVAVGDDGTVLVAGGTASGDIPTTPDGIQREPGQGAYAGSLTGDGFLAKIRLHNETERRVLFTTEPSGLQLTVDGRTVWTPAAFWWPAGASHQLGVPDPQFRGTSTFFFAAWSDGGGRSHAVAAGTAATVTASFDEVVGPTFYLKTEPAAVTIPRGEARLVTVFVVGVNGYDGPPVALSFPGPEAALVAAGQLARVRVGETLTLSLAAGDDERIGAHRLTMTGTNGSFTAPGEIEVQVTDRPAGAAFLASVGSSLGLFLVGGVLLFAVFWEVRKRRS